MLHPEKEQALILMIAQQLHGLTPIEIANLLDKTEKLLENIVGDFNQKSVIAILKSWDRYYDPKVCASDCLLIDYTLNFHLYQNVKNTDLPFLGLCYQGAHEIKIKPFTKSNIITSFTHHPW